MEIYKITNKVNGKVYIGQTIRPVEYRFHRHINDAMHNILDTHFARAIRKYGPDKWQLEQYKKKKSQKLVTKVSNHFFIADILFAISARNP